MINNIFTFGIRCVDSDISYEDMIIRVCLLQKDAIKI